MANETRILPIGGTPHSLSQPGTAQGKLRKWTRGGAGVAGGVQQQVNRMFRTESEGKPLTPRINDLDDVTRGLGLDSEDQQKIKTILQSTNASYGLKPHLRVPRIQHARAQLGQFLQATRRIESDVRMEIRKRAQEYWRKFGKTTYEEPPKVRYVFKKTDAMKKAQGSVDTGEDELVQARYQNPNTRRPHLLRASNIAVAYAKEQFLNLQGDDEQSDDEKKDKPKLDMKVKEKGKGHTIKFHDEVEADLPEDADFMHHATEYAKHHAGYLVNKDQDAKKAEAHRHAANIHARIGNAMHASGNARKMDEFPQFEEEGPPGKNAVGGDQPSKPDAKRNPPGRDSEREAKVNRKSGSGVGEAGKSGKPEKAEKSVVHTLRKA